MYFVVFDVKMPSYASFSWTVLSAVVVFYGSFI